MQKKIHQKHTAGFKTPKKYFEDFDEDFLSELHLKAQCTKHGFTVPQDYFDSFESSISTTIPTENVVKRIGLYDKFIRPYISRIAAALLLLFGILQPIENHDNISADLVARHFETSELSTYELAELLLKAHFIDANVIISKIDYTEQDLENYLFENADIETIITQ